MISRLDALANESSQAVRRPVEMNSADGTHIDEKALRETDGTNSFMQQSGSKPRPIPYFDSNQQENFVSIGQGSSDIRAFDLGTNHYETNESYLDAAAQPYEINQVTNIDLNEVLDAQLKL